MKGLLTSLITVLTFTGLQAQSLPAEITARFTGAINAMNK